MHIRIFVHPPGVENVSKFVPQSDGSATESAGAPAQDSSSNLSHSLMKEDLSSSVDDERTEEALIQETATLLASLSDVILSPIKAPRIDTSEKSSEVLNESEVRMIEYVHVCSTCLYIMMSCPILMLHL